MQKAKNKRIRKTLMGLALIILINNDGYTCEEKTKANEDYYKVVMTEHYIKTNDVYFNNITALYLQFADGKISINELLKIVGKRSSKVTDMAKAEEDILKKVIIESRSEIWRKAYDNIKTDITKINKKEKTIEEVKNAYSNAQKEFLKNIYGVTKEELDTINNKRK